MLIKINTSHINRNVLPRAPNPNRNGGIKINFDLALDLLRSSTIIENNDLSLTFSSTTALAVRASFLLLCPCVKVVFYIIEDPQDGASDPLF